MRLWTAPLRGTLPAIEDSQYPRELIAARFITEAIGTWGGNRGEAQTRSRRRNSRQSGKNLRHRTRPAGNWDQCEDLVQPENNEPLAPSGHHLNRAGRNTVEHCGSFRFGGRHRRTAKVDVLRSNARSDGPNSNLESDSLSLFRVQIAARPTSTFTHGLTRKRSTGLFPHAGIATAPVRQRSAGQLNRRRSLDQRCIGTLL